MGDSHTCSYTESKNLQCIFVGPGNENNLSSTLSLYIYLLKLLIIKRATNNFDNKTLGLIVGEADLRIAVYGSYSLKDSTRKKTSQERHIQRVLANFKRLCLLCNYFNLQISFVIGSGTPNKELFGISRLLNSELSTIARNLEISFFDPQSIFDTAEDRSSFFGKSVFNPLEDDWAHFSKHISKYFDEFSDNFIQAKPGKIGLENTSNNFVSILFNKEFDCYYCKYSSILKFFFKAADRVESYIRKFFS